MLEKKKKEKNKGIVSSSAVKPEMDEERPLVTLEVKMNDTQALNYNT